MGAWDVLVVGCGPAGASVARVVAAAGWRVLAVDRKDRLGEPNHCGEGVSHDCLLEAGLPPPQPWIRAEVPGCRIRFPNGSVIHVPRRGYCIDRPAFDRAVASRAAAAGAELRPGTPIRDLESTGDGWVVQSPAGPQRARYLVGAGGPTCPVARFVGEAPPTISAVQYKLPADDVPAADPDGWLVFHQNEELRAGYGWVFPRDGEVSVGVGSKVHPKTRLDEMCARLGIHVGRRLRMEGGPIPFLDRPPRLVHRRALLCGDAGGFVAPLTKGGVLGALWSGRLAGEVLVEALADDDPGRLASFPDRVAEHPSRVASHLRLPHALCDFDNRLFDAVGRIMDGRPYFEVPVLGFLRELVRCPTPRRWHGLLVALRVRMAYRRSERFAW